MRVVLSHRACTVVVSWVLALFAGSGTGLAQSLTLTPGPGTPGAGGGPSVRAGHDFASDVIGDPWDFEQASDWDQMYSLDALDPFKSAWASVPQSIGGVFTGTSQSAYPSINLQFEGIAGGFNMAGRNGVRYPIDAGKYRRLSFRVRRSVAPANTGSDLMVAMWFKHNTRASGGGGALFLSRGFDTASGATPTRCLPDSRQPVGRSTRWTSTPAMACSAGPMDWHRSGFRPSAGQRERPRRQHDRGRLGATDRARHRDGHTGFTVSAAPSR